MSSGLVLQNDAGIKWSFAGGPDGYACGSITVNGVLVESPLEHGFLFLRNSATGEERWLCGATGEQLDDGTATFSGEAELEGVTFSFRVMISLPENLQATRIEYSFSVDEDLLGWEVGFAYHAAYAHAWNCHLYPFVEDAKAVAEPRLTYVGVPSALLYRDDLSLALLFGLDLQFDYLNPITWTGDCGFFFTDGMVTTPGRCSSCSATPAMGWRRSRPWCSSGWLSTGSLLSRSTCGVWMRRWSYL
jgi:hypothetical protein